MIGEQIKNRRQALGLTQEELARRMGYKSKSTINKIELGINDVSQSKIVQFARALNTSVDYLMDMGGVEAVIETTPTDYGRLSTANKKVVNELIASLLRAQGGNNED
jgi:transcriptional regulator with XRE-family HTH domain